MKTKEFIKLIEGADFTVEDTDDYLYVSKVHHSGYTSGLYGRVSKKHEYCFDTNYILFAQLCTDIRNHITSALFEYSKTPIEERESIELSPAEPSKPVIPQIVAEQLEYWKRNKMNILWQFFLREIPSSTLSWLESDAGNYDKLLDAEKNGYEVEKLYYVKLPNTNSKSESLYLAQGNVSGDYWFNSRPERLDYDSDVCKHKFTEKEIKEYDERYLTFAVEVAE